MEKFDVIIIGAGPAGLKCAEELNNSGLRVLIVEKNNEIGPKVCAGGLVEKGAGEILPPEYAIERSYTHFYLNTVKKRKKIDCGREVVCTISRELLGKWQQAKIKEGNTKIRTNTRVSKIESGRIIIDDAEEIGYGFLVGADGANSLVRRYLGLESKKILIAMQYIIDRKFDDLELFLDSKLFGSHYAWIFPYKNKTSIGCGVDPKRFSVKKLKINFENWLKSKNINTTKHVLEASIINCDYKGYRFENIFLAGDAAGLGSYLTGEGIFEAYVSGREIAKQIKDDKYGSIIMKRIIRRKRAHDFLAEALYYSGGARNMVFDAIISILNNKLAVKLLVSLM